MANYLIAIGGTGARCLEAFTHAAAAGLIRSSVHILIIDPDLNNGNGFKLRQLINNYHELHLANQPEDPKHTGWFKGKAPVPALFQADLNRPPKGRIQYPIFWNNQNDERRKFEDVIAYTDQPAKFKNFLDLFYEPDDRKMVLNVGYQGRTNVGAVALKQDLEDTAKIGESGLYELLNRLYIDLQREEETKIFVMGSVFGGTGAAGIPTIPALIGNIDETIVPDEQRARLRYGCAMMTPYFVFPKNTDPNVVLGPGADSSRHVIATQAALLHYAHVPPDYQHVYFIGAPSRVQTNERNRPGGDQQKNAPHYAELAAALAAWDFFNLGRIDPDSRELHFADTIKDEQDLGVTWETLPVHPHGNLGKREEIKRTFVVFATFAYFYKNLLHNDIVGAREYSHSIWFKNNFDGFNLDEHSQITILSQLNTFCGSFLDWLWQLGHTSDPGNQQPVGVESRSILQLFNWDALKATSIRSTSESIGNLMLGDNVSPRYKATGEDRIKKGMDGIQLSKPIGTSSAAGLLIYLLFSAVRGFCHENYRWRD